MNQNIKTILLLIIFLTTTLFAKSEAILKLDTKGHTSLISDIIVTKLGDIISASDDKTISIWDSKTGKEKRKILGQIDIGVEGMVHAIAISNDEKYFAVGGSLSYYENNNRIAGIRIYNYKTGKLLKVLKSHTNVVFDLAFSKDDRYLISGSADKTAKIWEVNNNFRIKDTIKTHTKQVSSVKIIKKTIQNKNIYFAVTAGYDNKIALYDMKNHKVIKSEKLNYKLQYLAINNTKKHIAVCGYGKEIVIYDFSLNHIKTMQSETKPSGLSYDKKGKYLLAGTSISPRNTNIYKVSNNYTLYNSFKKHTNLTKAVAFLNSDDKLYAVSGGGNNNEIYIWDIDNLKVKKKIVGVGDSIWSVGINGDNIAWGNIDCGNTNCQKLQKSINLKDFKISNKSMRSQAGARERESGGFNRISTTNGNYSLSHSKGGDYGINDAVLNIKKDGDTKNSIVKNSTNGIRHRCYGWYDDYIISGGSSGHIKIYDKKGDEIASLIGHTGEIWSIALDGDTLISGSNDQTMMIWDLSKAGIDKKIYPMLNIFISSDNEYVAYTKEGFFTSSKNGAKYIGYHINQGVNKEARYLTVDKFYDSFYRPDLIQKALKGEDLSKYAKDINIDKLISSGLAPMVTIKTKSHKSKKRDINLNIEVCTVDSGGYNNLTLYLNDMAVDVIDKNRALKLKIQSKIRKECFTISKLISLQNGKNTIGFKATNKAGNIESNLDEITVNYKSRSNTKPNLHILSIGIDKYRDGDLWLKYSKADATEFTKAIQKVSKPLFKNIYTYKLLDKDVTKSKILDIFTKIGKKTTREDVFIFYMAGHGITDAKTGAYFYLPVDFRYKNENSVIEKGMSQNDFKLALSKIQAMKSLTILDTCNSGSFAEAMSSRGVLQKTAINKLTRATGRATIVASSKDQVALEGYKGHGVFTYTLLEALRGKGYGTDDKITIKELAMYIEDVLPDRTYEKWGYEQVPQSNISGNDFPIGVK